MNRTKRFREVQESDEPVTLAEFALRPLPKHGDYWGRWRYDAENMVLYDTKGWGYWIPLRDIEDSASVLDWVAQLYEKNWTTAENLGDLLNAFNDLFGGLQSKVCGFGFNHRFNLVEYLRKVSQ